MEELENVTDVERYITERLTIAGAENPQIFTAEAVDFIYQCTQGIPRQINNLCDNAMITAYSQDVQIIDRSIIETTAQNLDLLPNREISLNRDGEIDPVHSARVMTRKGFEEILREQPFFEKNQIIDDVQTSNSTVSDQNQ
jgi:hypothetical protein